MTYVTVDIGEVDIDLSSISTDELLTELADRGENEESNRRAFEELYLAIHADNKETVFRLASEIACKQLNKVI